MLIINLILLFAALFFLGFLLVRYVIVISRGLTTNQYLRNIYKGDNMRNPFNQGSVCLNWLAFFAEPNFKKPIPLRPDNKRHTNPQDFASQAQKAMLTPPQDSVASKSSGISKANAPRDKSSSLNEQPSTPNRFLRQSHAPRGMPRCCYTSRLEFESEITRDFRQQQIDHNRILQAFQNRRPCGKNQHSVKLKDPEQEDEKKDDAFSSQSDVKSQAVAPSYKESHFSQGWASTSFNSPKPPKTPEPRSSRSVYSPQKSYFSENIQGNKPEQEYDELANLASQRQLLSEPNSVHGHNLLPPLPLRRVQQPPTKASNKVKDSASGKSH